MTPGTVIDDRYQLLAEVGKGAMGSVHRARDIQSGALVAIKILALSTEVARFNRESSLLAKVSHPNIVRYIEHGESDAKMHFLVEEWLDGGTLRKRLRNPPGVSAREAVVMALALAEALGAAHDLGVIHRDVKPENILFVDDDPAHVKLVDFGIARLIDPDFKLTKTGVMVGTPSYMAPEQARGEGDITAAADVWGLGCVLYELLSGRKPFSGVHLAAIRAKVLLEEPPDLSELCPEAPPDLIELVLNMLSKLPIERPDNGVEVARLLRAVSEVPDGPRRTTKVNDSKTYVMPVRGHVTPRIDSEKLNCLMFVSPIDEDQTLIYGQTLVDVAAANNLILNVLEDGTAVLTSERVGREGAVGMTRAAHDIQANLARMAISVVGYAAEDRSEALERAAAAVEQCAIDSLFSDTGGMAIDAVIAELGQEDSAGIQRAT